MLQGSDLAEPTLARGIPIQVSAHRPSTDGQMMQLGRDEGTGDAVTVGQHRCHQAAGTLRVGLALAGSLSIGWLAPVELDAQHLTGRVVDDATEQSVSGAAIRFGVGERIVAHVITDASGNFRLSPPPGTYDIHVERLGYRAVVHPGVEIASTDTIHVLIRIGTDAIPLEPLTVVARGAVDARLERWGFYDRRESYTHRPADFLTRAEIEAKIPGRPTDIFHHLPRVRVTGGGRVQEVRIRHVGRYCRATLYLGPSVASGT